MQAALTYTPFTSSGGGGSGSSKSMRASIPSRFPWIEFSYITPSRTTSTGCHATRSLRSVSPISLIAFPWPWIKYRVSFTPLIRFREDQENPYASYMYNFIIYKPKDTDFYKLRDLSFCIYYKRIFWRTLLRKFRLTYLSNNTSPLYDVPKVAAFVVSQDVVS